MGKQISTITPSAPVAPTPTAPTPVAPPPPAVVAPVTNPYEGQLSQAYSQVLGRSIQQEGLDYWSSELESGNISYSTLHKALAMGALGSDVDDAIAYAASVNYISGEAVALSAYNRGEISVTDYIKELYKHGLKRPASNADAAYWAADITSGRVSAANMPTALASAAPDEYRAFSNGGYSSGMGIIHPNEYVLNAVTSSQMGLNDSSSTGEFGEMVALLKQVVKQTAETADNTERTARSA